jgi:hypothetical protein
VRLLDTTVDTKSQSLQQAGGYSGYHGVEYATTEGEAREDDNAQEAAEPAAGSPQAGRSADADGAQPASPSGKRAQPELSSPGR